MSDNKDFQSIEKDQEAYRDHIATVDQSGKRIWIYPKKPKGKLTNARTYVSWVLLLFLFGVPFIKVNGDPLLLFNLLERKFILFGILFTPQDFHLFVLAMLTFMVFIILFTVIFGRLFCGWVCPQTIFMEMVFRKIEYWIEGDASAQMKLNKAPWTLDKIIKKSGKQIIFFAIAILVSNTFLSYIIGLDEVIKIASEPINQNLGGFTAMILFSFAFYFVFSYMREQVCIAICPYGRMQGVLLDKNSIIVAYDFIRGEPRGKVKKTSRQKVNSPVSAIQTAVADAPTIAQATITEPALGDCIDCGLCVRVCPTGIDIRNGTQLECVNCTACIDACDEIMEKVDRPKGLIRYDSLEGIETKRKKIFTPRVIAYSAVLLVLIFINVFLLSQRTMVETLILRTPGMIYQEVDENTLSNLYNYQIINKSKEELPLEFRLINIEGNIKFIGASPKALPQENVEGAMLVELKKDVLKDRKTKLIFEIYSGGKQIDKVSTNFLGPMK